MRKENSKWDKFILKEYFGSKLDAQTASDIRDWLSDPDRGEEKWAEVENAFESQVQENPRFDTQTRQSLAEIHGMLGFPEPKRGTVQLTLRPFFRIGSAVAAAAAVIALVLFLALPRPEVIQINPVIADRSIPEKITRETWSETAVEKGKIVTLPDGSGVELKVGSSIAYSEDFIDNRRVVLNGEGFFRVERAAGKPFTVESNAISVTVLGTEFRMQDYSGQDISEVKLLSGSVAVTGEGVADRIVMEPGDHLVFYKENHKTDLTDLTPEELDAARGMLLYFRDESLETILRETARYYGRTLKVQPGVDLGRRLRVDFTEDESLNDVMYILQNISKDFEYEIDQDTIRVVARE